MLHFYKVENVIIKIDLIRRAIERRIFPLISRLKDITADWAVKPKLVQLRKSQFYILMPRRRILVLGVQSPRRPESLNIIFGIMKNSRHDIVFDSKEVDGIGKLANINILVARHNIRNFDWILMVDDDVELPSDFIDSFIALSEYADFKISSPAHRYYSYWSHDVTHRQHGSLIRQTNFVEVGPITAFHQDTYESIFPLPDLKYGWGLDFVWPVIAKRNRWKIGIIDGVALRHTNPIAITYNTNAAKEEAETYMAKYGVKTGVDKTYTISAIKNIF